MKPEMKMPYPRSALHAPRPAALARILLLIPALALLAGCMSSADFGGDNVRSHLHRTLSASGLRSVRIANVSGSITVQGSDKPLVTVDAVRHGSDQDALNRTQVIIERSGGRLDIRTHYKNDGGIFGNHSGAGVDYVVQMPSNAALEIANVSGKIALRGLGGDVDATDVSGTIRSSLGMIGGSRNVRMNTVSGPIEVAMNRKSSAALEAKTLSGAVTTFFPSDSHKGMVGTSLRGTIGNGSATIKLSSISGAITVDPQ